MMKRVKNMLIGKRLLIALGVLLTVVAAPVAIVLMNQYMNTEATVSDALRQDAQSYAAEWGIGLDEAVRRLQLQGEIGKFGADLEKNEAGTYAGHWIKHGSGPNDFGVVVRFTSNGERTVQQYGQHVANGPLAGMVEVRRADATLAELKTAQRNAITSLRPLGIRVESSINLEQNWAEIYVVDKSRLESAMSAANVELPDKVELTKVESLSKPMADIYGGLHLSSCTAGFSVEHSNGTKGITTADHCGDSQAYNGTTLPREDGAYGGWVDLQWHSASGFTVRNKIQDGLGDDQIREIDATRHYDDQSVNDYVCIYGMITRYRCGYIKTKLFLPDHDDCPGCLSAGWIKVHKNGISQFIERGDSGGPVFSGNTALGTIAFRAPDGGGVYMAVNHMSSLGLSVLTD